MGRSRSWRRYQTQRVIEGRLRLVRNYSQDWESWYEMLLKKRSKLAHRSPYDCGKTRCQICHFEKVWHRKDRYNEYWKAIQEELRHAV